MAGKAVRVLKAVPEPGNPDSFIPERAERRANGKLTVWQQNELMRELALGDKRPADLAREYGVSTAYMAQFAKRYARQIAAMKADISNACANLWGAKKANRLAVLQKMAADRFNSPNRTAEDDRTIATLLKNMAEELGDLPTRTQVVSAHVVHVIEGFTSDELEGYLS